ncbi:MAG: integrase [Burkholderiales bacterium RIFCSPHIGHO2_12_FULL_61_11]|nr:MAG: integrase [Burkholderiales bacterium RIFCSPHIGHO2_12_FULL_61_11]
MGKVGAGVEIRETSIRLKFVYEGAPVKRTLLLNGSPMLPTPANVKYANRLAAEIRDKIRHDTFSMAEYFPANGIAGVLTVKVQLDTWLEGQRIEPSTRAAYSSAIRFWTGEIGDIAIRSLKHSNILKALATRPLLTGKTVNNYVDVLRQAMQLAVLDKVLTANPVADIPRASHQKEPPDPFSLEEAEKIIADMAKHYPEQVYNYCETKFFTGLRTSEGAGLQWPRVDLPSAYLQVSEAIVMKEQKDRTKTNQVRNVRLNSRALAALQRQAKHTRMVGEHVFNDPRYDKPWMDERAFRRSYWTPTLKRLGIRYRVPYQTRHTYATMMLMAGMTPAFCAKQMGHSVEVFLSTYAKWLGTDRDDAEMQRLEDSIKVPAATLKAVK